MIFVLNVVTLELWLVFVVVDQVHFTSFFILIVDS